MRLVEVGVLLVRNATCICLRVRLHVSLFSFVVVNCFRSCFVELCLGVCFMAFQIGKDLVKPF